MAELDEAAVVKPAKADARTLLEGLVGEEIPTMTGVPNRVLRIEGSHVIVGTGKSPHGKPVEIADVQDAIDRLWRDGVVEINVDFVGRRSAFIGAVLQSIPGTIASTNPRVVRLERRPPQDR